MCYTDENTTGVRDLIDIHSHILPQMDDGARDAGESRQMLAMLWAQGVEVVAATPHFYAHKDTLGDFLHRRDEALARLEYDSAQAPRIILGAEVAYFDSMSSSRELRALQLGASGLVLVEMPFGTWTDRMVREVCQTPVRLGLTPVLAHVERYRRRDQFPKFREQLLEHGIYFQCNATAFLPFMEGRWTLGQLARGNVHFLGSDSHNLTTRPPKLDQAAGIITRKLGSHILEGMSDFAKDMLKL